jgi:4'-phosphopantetheinyl transferase
MSVAWPVGAERQPAPHDEIHVWRVELDRTSPSPSRLPAVERERAGRIRPVRVRERWVSARWALRRVLGSYLDEDPAQIPFRYRDGGKPELADGTVKLCFNLSHSGPRALIAVASGREVGVDIERIDHDRDVLELAERGLGAADAATVRNAEPETRAAAFHAAWVRQEAIAKCLGVGLAAPPPPIPVAALPLDAGPGWAAAVAVAGPMSLPVRRWTLTGSYH